MTCCKLLEESRVDDTTWELQTSQIISRTRVFTTIPVFMYGFVCLVISSHVGRFKTKILCCDNPNFGKFQAVKPSLLPTKKDPHYLTYFQDQQTWGAPSGLLASCFPWLLTCHTKSTVPCVSHYIWEWKWNPICNMHCILFFDISPTKTGQRGRSTVP